METNNGGLFFEAGIDNEKLKAGIEETIRRIQGLSDASVKGGKAMDEVFDKVSADITSSFEKIDFIINEHKSSIKELEKEYRQIGLANIYFSCIREKYRKQSISPQSWYSPFSALW